MDLGWWVGFQLGFVGLVVVANSVAGSRLDGSGRLGFQRKTRAGGCFCWFVVFKMVVNWYLGVLVGREVIGELVVGGGLEIGRRFGVCRARETGSGGCDFNEDDGCVGWVIVGGKYQHCLSTRLGWVMAGLVLWAIVETGRCGLP